MPPVLPNEAMFMRFSQSPSFGKNVTKCHALTATKWRCRSGNVASKMEARWCAGFYDENDPFVDALFLEPCFELVTHSSAYTALGAFLPGLPHVETIPITL